MSESKRTYLDIEEIEKIDKNSGNNEELSRFSKRLLLLHKEKNLTLDKVASKVFISKTSYSDYLNGNTVPGIICVIRLADFFNVSTDYLLGIDDNRSFENEFIRKKTGLTDEAIGILAQFKVESDESIAVQHPGESKLFNKLGQLVGNKSKILNELLTNRNFYFNFIENLNLYYYNSQSQHYSIKKRAKNSKYEEFIKDLPNEQRDLILFKMQNILMNVVDDIDKKMREEFDHLEKEGD